MRDMEEVEEKNGLDGFKQKRHRHASGESTDSTMSNYIPTPPDGGWGWIIVLASFINHIIIDGIAFTFGVFYIEFLSFFGESQGKTAFIGSLLCGFYLMTGPIAAALTNKFGCRRVCMCGSVVACCAFLLSTLSPNVDILMLTYGVLGGFGFGLMYLPSIISVSYYFQRRRAVATGIAVCGAGVGDIVSYVFKGMFVFAPVGRILIDNYSWKNAMWLVAGIVLHGVLTGMLMRPLEPPKSVRRPREKNFFDRWKEKRKEKLRHTSGKSGGSNHDDEAADEVTEMAFKTRMQELRMAKQTQFEEDKDSIGPISHETSNEASRNNSIRKESLEAASTPVRDGTALEIPQIVIQESSVENLAGGDAADGRGAVIPHPTANGQYYSSVCLPTGAQKLGGVMPPHDNEQLMLTPHDMCHVSLVPPVRRRRPPGVSKADYARPLYRKDIFYSGSVIHVPQFNSAPNMKAYMASITSIPAELPYDKEQCSCIPKSMKDVLLQLCDFSILKDPIFLVACLGNVFGMLGLFVPFMYIAQRAIELSVSRADAVFLLSVIGITNTIGRVVAGFLADRKNVNTLFLHNVSLILAGISCILNMFCDSYALMCVFAAVFGICVATWISLTSIILCDLLGLQKLTNSFGLLTLMRGLASIGGPPLAGFVYDVTQSFDASFVVGGVMLILAGLLFMLLHLPCLDTDKQHDLDSLPVPPIDDEAVPDTMSSNCQSPTSLPEEFDNGKPTVALIAEKGDTGNGVK